MSSGTIAGFGFSTIQRRDLSDLDEILSRIEDLGASMRSCRWAGPIWSAAGAFLSQRVDRLERICARHRLRYTAHWPARRQLHGSVHLDAYKAAVGALLQVCAARSQSLPSAAPTIPGRTSISGSARRISRQ